MFSCSFLTLASRRTIAGYTTCKSTPDHPGQKGYDALGQRSVAATVFLQRPISEDLSLGTVGLEVQNGTVIFEMKKAKDGTVGVRVGTVRNR